MTTISRVHDILQEQLGIPLSDLTPEARLIEDLGADSLDLLELVMECESEFDIDIPDAAADTFLTIHDLTTYITANK